MPTSRILRVLIALVVALAVLSLTAGATCSADWSVDIALPVVAILPLLPVLQVATVALEDGLVPVEPLLAATPSRSPPA